ncbi:MAG TPA: hypothetical protein VFY62_02240 [Pseudomonas sp.]|nr:hypothetical protein [Pseudomonas sp.]
MTRQCWRYWLFALLCGPALSLAAEVGLVTALSGTVALQGAAQGESRALQAFSKLHEGDRLTLSEGARLQLVFFHGAQEQVWQGAGELQVAAAGAAPQPLGWQPQVRQLPQVLVKQLAKTPAPDGQVKAGMVRLRSMPSGGTLESVEKRYTQLRQQALGDDRNPELYLLASYFELQEYAKLQGLLQKMAKAAPADGEVKLLQALYGRAINSAKNAARP